MTTRPFCYHSDPLHSPTLQNDKNTPVTVKKAREGYKAALVTEIKSGNLSVKTMWQFVKLTREYRETLGDIKLDVIFTSYSAACLA